MTLRDKHLDPAVPSSNPDVVLKMNALSKSFDRHRESRTVLKDITLDIYARELVCIIGPSGCGKSTLSRMIVGLDRYTSGSMHMDGQLVVGPSSERGMVFQGYTLFPWKTVKQNIMFGPKIKGISHLTAESKAREWMDIVGLENYQDHYPHQLSGGMKQRVAIARSLVNEPKILVMDEPFAALDPYTRQKMQRHLVELWKKINITIIFVTHDMDEAIVLADRIIVLKSNPGEVKDIISVDLPRPRDIDMRHVEEFKALRKRIDRLIHTPEETPSTH